MLALSFGMGATSVFLAYSYFNIDEAITTPNVKTITSVVTLSPQQRYGLVHIGVMFICGLILGKLGVGVEREDEKSKGFPNSYLVAHPELFKMARNVFNGMRCVYLLVVATTGYVFYKNYDVGILTASSAGGSGYLFMMYFLE